MLPPRNAGVPPAVEGGVNSRITAGEPPALPGSIYRHKQYVANAQQQYMGASMVSNSAPTTNIGAAADSTVTANAARLSRNTRRASPILVNPVMTLNSTAGVRINAPVAVAIPHHRPI